MEDRGRDQRGVFRLSPFAAIDGAADLLARLSICICVPAQQLAVAADPAAFFGEWVRVFTVRAGEYV